VHLVSSSVPEMNPKAVSLLDQNGPLRSGIAERARAKSASASTSGGKSGSGK